MKKYKLIIPALLTCCYMQARTQEPTDSTALDGTKNFTSKVITVGFQKEQSLRESTASVSIVNNEEFNKRSAKNIGNSLFGHGTGLTTLQSSGRYTDYEPAFFVRGLQSLSTNSPLFIVDGIERDIKDITPEEVETVAILKDAAAVAIYGYKGINGVVSMTTKRGKYNSKSINVFYEHGFDWQTRKPKFVNSYDYANAVNEAMINDDPLSSGRYNADEIEAFRSGNYPYLYPNVDWADETFRDIASTNIYNVSFTGGTQKFRYYAMGNLTSNNGFIGNPDENNGYSTQDQYSRANLRTNLDIDLTETTKMKLNVLGVLSETRMPGASVNLWNMIYTLPAAAYPVKLADGTWGGNSTWAGTSNPVAASQAGAYSKYHDKSLFVDMNLDQDLSIITPGLGINGMLAYDNYSNIYENHSKTYLYGSDAVSSWLDGKPDVITRYTDGKNSEMATTEETTTYQRAFNVAATLYYDKQINDNNKIYSQLKYDHEYRNSPGTNTTWYRYNTSLYTHYGYKDRYFADVTLMLSACNRLAPGNKWAFSPTVSLAWILSEENFAKDIAWLDFLKLRGSFGVINSDRLPLDSNDNEIVNYFEETYGSSGSYPFEESIESLSGSQELGRLIPLTSTHEKAYKYNFGVDASLFKSWNLTLETYYERRADIWVGSAGKYSWLLGFSTPYENAGIVDSWGFELGTSYTIKIGDVNINLGANLSLVQNEIVEQLEEYRLYDNLKTTGNSLKQTYGLQAIGFFKDEADIAASPKQTFSAVKPGDIKYRDVTGDGIIDSNDKTAIGYSTTLPELYYSFNLGAEWKGIGVDAMFQGVGRYSAVLNTQSVYKPLVGNTNISEEYYDNRWTPQTPDAKYPRLSAQSNTNNYQTNTLWLEDRSFLKLRSVELYYKLPQTLLNKTKVLNAAKIYVRGIDLLCFDKIEIADPERYGATAPVTASLIAGVSIEF